MIKDAQMACSAVIFCGALTAPAMSLSWCEPGHGQSWPLLVPTPLPPAAYDPEFGIVMYYWSAHLEKTPYHADKTRLLNFEFW